MADSSPRYRYLDLLRGIAILGILPANIVYFGHPAGDLDAGRDTMAGDIASHLTSALVEFKFVSLFAVLFGVGLILIRQRAEAAGRAWRATVIRRLVLLAGFGIAHATLLWYGDILFVYALLGVICVWASAWSCRTLVIVGAILCAAPACWCGDGLGVATLHAESRAELDAIMNEPDAGTAADATGPSTAFAEAAATPSPEFETAVYREAPFRRIVWLRTYTWLGSLLFLVLPLLGWRVAVLFLIGMAMAKAEWFLDPGRHPRPFRRMVVWGCAWGLPWAILGRALAIGAGSDLAASLCDYVGAFGLAAAYAGAVGWLAARRDGGWRRPLEAIGRTAFTNYLLQSLLCTTFFYGYGFDWFGQLDRAQLLVVVAAVWVVQLVWSPLWLRTLRRVSAR